MSLIHCQLPLLRVATPDRTSSNQCTLVHIASRQAFPNTGKVRVMQRSRDCYALSGKLSDVCAALDAMAAREHMHPLRWAAH